jgi:hypothetical protein
MYKQLSRMGWRIREPVGDELSAGRPHPAENIAQALIDNGFSLQEVANLAGSSGADHNLIFKPASPALRVVLAP